MTTLIECLTRIEAQPLAHAVGWALLHFCWQGAVVALMLWWVLRLLHGRPSQARYAAACSALLLLTALPLVTFVQLAQDELAASRAASIPIYIAASTLVVSATSAAPEPLLTRIEELLRSSVPWLPVMWLAGVAFFLVRLNIGLIAARRMKSAGAQLVGDELRRAFERLRVRLGVERAVRLMHSAMVEVPTVIGWLRPVVLVPASCLTGLSPMQIEAVLAHELAHVRRHDYLVSVFQSVVEALLFYHPAVWWVSRQVRRERECCCDELAVAVGGDVVAYARALSYLEERRGSVPEFVLGANGGVLTMRIKRLLGRGENAAVSQVAALVVLAVIMGGVGSYWATVAHAQKQRAQAAATHPEEPIESTESNQLLALGGIQPLPFMHSAQQAAVGGDAAAPLLKGVYKRWLEQDVRWIITDAEAQAYRQLTNDEERDQFIEHFWQRRNPNPDSPENEYRDEVYARIAYANEHFAADKPGWSTERGHIYIVYGKPESIDAHPSGGGPSSSGYPFEVWHYNYIPGIGDHVDLEFVDTCRCGNYNLTVDNLTNGQPGQTGAGAGAENGRARAILASRLLAPGGAGAPQSADPSTAPPSTAGRNLVSTYLMPGIQSKDGSIDMPTGMSWTIADPNGAPVAGAKVTATNTDNGVQTSGVTDHSGTYAFSLPPGPYNVEFEARGFARTLQENVHVNAGQWNNWNLKLSVPGAAQTPAAGAARETGSIAGVVVDPTGARVPRAFVTTINTDTGWRMVKQTDNSGNYLLSPLPPGPYLVEIEAKGFQRLLQENVQVKPGQTLSLNLRLTIGGGSQSVTVTGSPLAAAPPPPPPPLPAVTGRPLGPVRISTGTAEGMIISQVDPVYPDEARAAHVQGTVVLHATLSKTGDVKNLEAIGGPPELMVSAIDAVRQWKYKPFLLNGEPTEVSTTININFKLKDTIAAQGQGPTLVEPAPGPVRVYLMPGIEVGPETLAGNLIRKVEPVYPEIAKAAHVQGTVMLRTVIAKTGDVKSVEVVSGPPMLTGSAVEAARQWIYKPYLLNGQPTEVSTTINMNFNLADATATQGQSPSPTITPVPEPGKEFLQVPPPVVEKNLIHKVDPVYPEIAKAAHVQGTVVLRTVISKAGNVEKVEVVSGPPMLTGSAMEAVRQWIYKPYLLNGQPTEVWTIVEINFNLADAAALTQTAQEYEAKAAALAKAAQEYRELIASDPAAPVAAQAQARLMQTEAELKQAQAELTMQDAQLNAIRTQYNGEPVRKIGGGVTAPMPIYEVEPEYTPEARKAKFNGIVLVGLIVDTNGLPQNVHVLRGVGMGLDENAVAAVKQYKFKPAMEAGKSVPVEVNLEVNFKIF